MLHSTHALCVLCLHCRLSSSTPTLNATSPTHSSSRRVWTSNIATAMASRQNLPLCSQDNIFFEVTLPTRVLSCCIPLMLCVCSAFIAGCPRRCRPSMQPHPHAHQIVASGSQISQRRAARQHLQCRAGYSSRLWITRFVTSHACMTVRSTVRIASPKHTKCLPWFIRCQLQLSLGISLFSPLVHTCEYEVIKMHLSQRISISRCLIFI